jgi:predicted nucleic acid-binding Zn ribbon protein
MRKEPFNKGAWAVQRERCQVADDRPSPPRRDQPVASIARQIIKELKLEARVTETRLLNEWPQIVGPQVATHARPGRLERGVLTVFVANSVWLAELSRMWLKPMLNNIQRQLGNADVRSLRLQLDPDPPQRKAGA